MTNTNIKNLPAGNTYFSECGYSDTRVWVEVKRTAKTVTLAPVEVERDPEWKPDFSVGGFAGHCNNQSDQTWLFDHIDYRINRTVRMTIKGWSYRGITFVENTARYLYDYNF